MSRAIIHLNIADFAVAVERQMDHRLEDRPVIIARAAVARAVVYDMSEEAYAGGIRKGMPLRRAVRRIPDATVLVPHPDRYERAMDALLKKVLPYSPLIEPGEDDGHLFVDVTGTSRLFGPSMDVAWRLHRQIRTDLGLDPIWSVAANKLVAKVAPRVVKPTGEYIVGSGDEASFLASLPLGLIPGIEAGDLARLREFNLTQVRHVAALGLNELEVPFGRQARFLYEAVRGIDPSPVRSVNQQSLRATVDHTFDDDTNERSVLEGALYALTEQIAVGLRRRRLAASRVRLVLDHSDGVRHIRQKILSSATANDLILFKVARSVFDQAWTRRVRIRHLRLICDRLAFPPAQIPLFDVEREAMEKGHNLINTVDRIRERFGHDAVRVGRTLVPPLADRLAGEPVFPFAG